MRLSITLFGAVLQIASALSPQDCATFAKKATLSNPKATLLNSTYVPANELTILGRTNQHGFCRVYGKIAYGKSNKLGFQIWLPDADVYNNRFLAIGNGGMAGKYDSDANEFMVNINKGYAIAACDSGHEASAINNFGIGSPGLKISYLQDKDQVETWIHNSIAMHTPTSRELVESFYGEKPSYSYYKGCSTGGAQGFALALFHPYLFDGIIAGCSGDWYSHLILSFLWNTVKSQGDGFLPQSTLDLITEAAIDKCDLLDGVEDRLIENPLICDFDIKSLACDLSTKDISTCLTPAQITTAEAIYAGPTRPDGTQIYPGFSTGSESAWLDQQSTLTELYSTSILQNLVFKNLKHDVTKFNWDSDVDLVDREAGVLIDANDVDFSRFRANGGKMLEFQGWADSIVAATWPIQRLREMEHFFGGSVSSFFSLFMIPGGGHCTSSEKYPSVPGVYHVLEALVNWVELGIPPMEVYSDKPPNGENISRKLCPWPQTAQYLSGDVKDFNSYFCGEPDEVRSFTEQVIIWSIVVIMIVSWPLFNWYMSESAPKEKVA